jgi:hypothetical protein
MTAPRATYAPSQLTLGFLQVVVIIVDLTGLFCRTMYYFSQPPTVTFGIYDNEILREFLKQFIRLLRLMLEIDMYVLIDIANTDICHVFYIT